MRLSKVFIFRQSPNFSLLLILISLLIFIVVGCGGGGGGGTIEGSGTTTTPNNFEVENLQQGKYGESGSRAVIEDQQEWNALVYQVTVTR